MNTHIGFRESVSKTLSDLPKLNQDIVIRLENVSVAYRIPQEQVSGIKEFAIRWLQRRIRYRKFLALRNVNLSIHKGENFGIVGRNGAGKSTLLKLIARVLIPTEGRVWVIGNVAPLLELGAGFHPELTGRENVYLYGTLLGYKRAEIDALFESIVDFAEIWDFIEAPLRTYSTGMVARLAFATATCSPPDIILVDEVLSVGDMNFQKKCMERMQGFVAQGTTLLIVSHNMSIIRQMCDRAAWLSHGELMAMGLACDVVAEYSGGATIMSSSPS